MATPIPFFRNVIRDRFASQIVQKTTDVSSISDRNFTKPDATTVYKQAKACEAAGDCHGAERRWSELYDYDQRNREALIGLVSALQASGRYKDAETRFREAPAEHAEHLDHAICFAQNAQLRSDLESALSRSIAIVERFPEHPYGYGTAALLLAAAGRHEEGFEILEKGSGRFPNEASLILPSIRLAVARQDWSTAAADLKRLDERFPPTHAIRVEVERLKPVIAAGYAAVLHRRAFDAEGARDFRAGLEAWEKLSSLHGPTRDILLGLGRCRRESGAFAAADRALGQAAADYPGDAEIHANIAQVPAVAGDWPEAASRWRAVIGQFPDITALAGMAAQAFARAGDRSSAEAVLDRAIERDPSSLDLRTARASTAQVVGDWKDAVDRWGEVVALAPDDLGYRILLDEAALRLQAETLAQDAGVTPPSLARIAPFEGDETIPMKEMVKHFESLGDNCEFGVVQRHFGAEPITLFRFAAIDPERMIDLLDVELEPLGDPAHTYVSEMMNEYYIKDDRGYYYMHTFVKAKQIDAERYIRQQIPRIAYLKRNFLADLRTGEKIYVCKLSTAQVTDDTLRRLSRILRRFGDNLLLGGRRADEDHPVGSVERLDDNILIGYTTPLYGEADRPVNSASWGKVMKAVYQYRSMQSASRVVEPAA